MPSTIKHFIAMMFALAATGAAAMGIELIAYYQLNFFYGHDQWFTLLATVLFFIAIAPGILVSERRKSFVSFTPVSACETLFIVLSLFLFFIRHVLPALPTALYPWVFISIAAIAGFTSGYEYESLSVLNKIINPDHPDSLYLLSSAIFGAGFAALLLTYSIPVSGLKLSTLFVTAIKIISALILSFSWKKSSARFTPDVPRTDMK